MGNDKYSGTGPFTSDRNIRLLGRASFTLFLLVLFPLILHAQETGDEGAPASGKPRVGRVPQKAPDVLVPDPQDFTVKTFAENLEIPWEMVFLPDGRVLLTERPGRIRVIKDGKLMDEPYAKIKVTDIGEGGLMGLALHPDYPRQPYLYVMYTRRDGIRLINRVERLKDTGSAAVSDRIIVDGIPGARFHDGGRIAFGPDGMLYVCTGDARKPERAQDLRDLGGKILRYTPDGAIPGDNPFPGSPVYAYGLRNPQGLAWDPKTGMLFASDHGPSGEFGLQGHDSLKVIVKGGNYGWPLVLGVVNLALFIDPLVLWVEATPPAGMVFHQGDLYVATLKSEALIRVGLSRKGKAYEVLSVRRLFAQGPEKGKYGRIRDVVAGPDNSLYLLTSNRDGRGSIQKGDDKILRLIPK
jgi:glucose/arabinose dehydrogenase